MKIKIEYERHPANESRCLAKTVVWGDWIVGSGDTWDEARKVLLHDVRKLIGIYSTTIPQTEEVEV